MADSDTEMELIDQSETTNQPLSVDPTGDNELDWVLVRLEDLAVTVAREKGEQFEKAEEGGTDQMTKAREDQVRNNAGGFVWQVNDENRIRRFLVLGTSGGTYYQTEKEMTMENVGDLVTIIENGKGGMLLKEIISISLAGRAPKQEPTLFALALCARYKVNDAKQMLGKRKAADPKEQGDALEVDLKDISKAYAEYTLLLQKAAFYAVHKVCRIPTHLFSFVAYCEKISGDTGTKKLSSGWGRMMRTTIAKWYIDRPVSQLAMHITKYQQRNGWSHRDLLRLCHAHPNTFKMTDAQAEHQLELEYLLHFAVNGDLTRNEDKTEEMKATEIAEKKKKADTRKNKPVVEKVEVVKKEKPKKKTKPCDETAIANYQNSKAIQLLTAFLEMKHLTEENADRAVQLIKEHGMVREHLPTLLLNNKSIWIALLQKMPMTAMIRNLGKMASIKILDDSKENSANLKLVVSKLTDADQLHKSRIHPLSVLLASETFKAGRGIKGSLTWEPATQVMEALDKAFVASFKNVEPTGKRYCIGMDVSGSMGSSIMNTHLSCRVASAALATVALRTEPRVECVAFCDKLTELPFTKDWTLEKICEHTNGMPFGGTDCALPMVWALKKKKQFDVFMVLTDNETWFGQIHPFEALKKYREKMNLPHAKLIVVGMTASPFTIADPLDPGMLDVVGFDSAVPQLISDFVMERI